MSGLFALGSAKAPATDGSTSTVKTTCVFVIQYYTRLCVSVSPGRAPSSPFPPVNSPAIPGQLAFLTQFCLSVASSASLKRRWNDSTNAGKDGPFAERLKRGFIASWRPSCPAHLTQRGDQFHRGNDTAAKGDHHCNALKNARQSRSSLRPP